MRPPGADRLGRHGWENDRHVAKPIAGKLDHRQAQILEWK